MDLRNQYSPQPKASVNIVFKVHKNSHWSQQKTIIVYYYRQFVDAENITRRENTAQITDKLR